MNNLKVICLFCLISLNVVNTAFGQISDYSLEPATDFEFHNMQLTLEVVPESDTFRGVVTWSMSAIRDSVKQIKLIALRSDVKSVRVDEQLSDFEFAGDTLVIEVGRYLNINDPLKLEIIYAASPLFGVHKTPNGTYWSSLLPGVRSDLFPSIPHPSIQTTTDIRLILPQDWKGVANGVFVSTTLMPEGKRLYHWKSSVPVAVTDIGIIAGKLDYWEEKINSIPVRVYAEADAVMGEDVQALFVSMQSKFDILTETLRSDYPYQALNIVLLPDHMWETRTAGAALGYLFENGNDTESQLARILSAQFFGSFHRMPVLSAGNHILLMQAYLYKELLNSDTDVNSAWSDYPEFEDDSWKIWSPGIFDKALLTLSGDTAGSFVDGTVIKELAELPGSVYTWEDYQTSLHVLENEEYPGLREPAALNKEYYTINYSYDEASNRYSIEVVPDGYYENRILPLVVRQFSAGSVNDVDYMISTRGDEISFASANYIENIYLINSDESLVFTENKPAHFWVYQLRSDSNYERRIESAVGFSRVTDDPDIQLFLQDLIRNEPDELVKSKLVESYASLTSGALGTHQRFISLLDDRSPLVRYSALDALRKYPGNEQAQQAVFRIISLSPDVDYVNQAISVYKDIIDEEEFFSVARSLLVEDLNDLNFTAAIIPLIVQTERGKEFAPNLMQYLEAGYPFYLRNLALNTLKEMEISPSYWLDILPELLIDTDPRVRYLALDLIPKIDKNQAVELLNSRSFNEYDVRILHKVQNLLQNM